MAETRREIILLAGMHRCGTSALARILNIRGACIPGSLLPASDYNPRGYWEAEEVLAINNRALHCMGLNWTTINEFEPDWYDSLAGRAFLADVRRFVGELGDDDLLLIKDPRFSLLAPGWLKVLDAAGFAVKVIIAFRDPREVAQSLSSRQLIYVPHEAWPPERSYAIWLNHLLAIERTSRGVGRSFVNYDSVLADWRSEVARISSDLDLTDRLSSAGADAEIDAFLSRDLKRAQAEGAYADDDIVGQTLKLLNQAVGQPLGLEERFDAAHAAFAGARRMFGAMVTELQHKNDSLAGAPARPSLSADHRPSIGDVLSPAEPDMELRLRHQALLKVYAEVVSAAAQERKTAAETVRQLDRQSAALEVQLRGDAVAQVQQLDRKTAAAEARVRTLEMECASLEERLRRQESQSAEELHRAVSAAATSLEAERGFQLARAAIQKGRLIEQIAATRVAVRRDSEDRWRLERTAILAEHEVTRTILEQQLQEEHTDLERACEALAEARGEVSDLRGELQAGVADARDEALARAATHQAAVAELDRLHGSRSWRMTRPLRALRRRLGRPLV